MSDSSFEKDITRLEQIVERLESDDCNLEEAMDLFEEGIKLSKSCNDTLEKAKQKIVTLTEKENGDA